MQAQDVAQCPVPAATSSPHVAEDPTNPNSAVCDFYLTHKRRFCKTEKRPGGYRYCHTHQAELHANGEAGGTSRRVPCPINPKHTVYERDLKRHVLVCPDRRHDPTGLPYFSLNCHALKGACYVPAPCPSELAEAIVETMEDPEDVDDKQSAVENRMSADEPVVKGSARFTHRDLSEEALRALTEKVLRMFNQFVQPMIRKSHSAVVASDASARLTMKHSTQHLALTNLLATAIAAAFAPSSNPTASVCPTALVELGAGKGGLAYAVSEAMSKHSEAWRALIPRPPKWLIVDLGGFRRKRDGCVRKTDHVFQRLRINIKDLALSRVPQLAAQVAQAPAAEGSTLPAAANSSSHCTEQSSGERLVAMGKHLCGACTDFAISCVTSALPDRATCQVLLLATCCHHLCELRHLNPIRKAQVQSPSTMEEVLEFHGETFTPSEFAAIVSMTSWAVCGAHMVSEEKRTIGYACKRIIDALRLAHLTDVCGFRHAEMHEYADAAVTAENVCLLAWR